jgi:hypothetical protein
METFQFVVIFLLVCHDMDRCNIFAVYQNSREFSIVKLVCHIQVHMVLNVAYIWLPYSHWIVIFILVFYYFISFIIFHII